MVFEQNMFYFMKYLNVFIFINLLTLFGICVRRLKTFNWFMLEVFEIKRIISTNIICLSIHIFPCLKKWSNNVHASTYYFPSVEITKLNTYIRITFYRTITFFFFYRLKGLTFFVISTNRHELFHVFSLVFKTTQVLVAVIILQL